MKTISSNNHLSRNPVWGIPLLLIMGLLLLAPERLHGSLLVYEGFAYSANQSLHEDADGGLGWDGSWMRASGTQGPQVRTEGALHYEDELGNTLVTTGFGAEVQRTFRNAVRSPENRMESGTYWLSFLIRPTYELFEDEANMLRLSLRDEGTTRINMGKIGANEHYGINAQSDSAYSEVSGEELVDEAFPTQFLVVRYHIGEGEDDGAIHLFMNPLMGEEQEPDLNAADAALTGLDSTAMAFNEVHFDGTGGGSQERTRGYLDEIRIGSSFASVTPFETPPTPPPPPVYHYGYLVEDGYVNTHEFLGYLQVDYAPWAYSFSLGNWINLPDPESEIRHRHGVWFYALRGETMPEEPGAEERAYGFPVDETFINTDEFLGYLDVSMADWGWVYSYAYGNWMYLGDRSVDLRQAFGSWAYLLNVPIQGLAVTEIRHNSVRLRWDTLRPSSIRVEYGLSEEALTESVTLPEYEVEHAVRLENLTLDTTYYYQIVATDEDGQVVSSALHSFTTAAEATSFASELTQHGITWTFDQEYEFGEYANGDYWVIGPITIVSISPNSTEIDGRTRHGSMINPSPRDGGRHGYDSSMDRNSYDPTMNVALDVSAQSPLVVPPHSSLVSTISVEEAGNRPQIRDSAILTVVETLPAEGSFRSPYSGDDKAIRFTIADLDYSLLHRLPTIPGTPNMSTVANRFARPWVEHIPGWTGREAYPQNNMPGYGRDLSARVGEAALMLHLDFPDSIKEPLLIRFVQLGIDNYGIVADGGRTNWVPNGGHGSGRKWPILFAGLILDNHEMKNIGEKSGSYLHTGTHRPGNPPSDYLFFGEDSQTFYVEETSDGVYNYGHGDYTAEHVGMPEYGIRHATDPSRSMVAWGGSPYRTCCTGNAWPGFVLAARIMGVQDLWNHDPLFDYQDRFMEIQKDASSTSTRSWNAFVGAMWDTYRDQF